MLLYCYYLGDAAYLLSIHLLTPYKDNGRLTDQQKKYNFKHSYARNIVERAFGVLKFLLEKDPWEIKLLYSLHLLDF